MPVADGLSRGAPATQVLAPECVADFITWLAASPPEPVLAEGYVLSVEERLPWDMTDFLRVAAPFREDRTPGWMYPVPCISMRTYKLLCRLLCPATS